MGVAPGCFIDFLFVAYFEADSRFRCNEDGVTHFPARAPVLGSNFLPQPNTSKLEVRKLFLDLPSQAILSALSGAFSPSGKHPKLVAPVPYKQHPSSFRGYQFRRFHSPTIESSLSLS